MTQTTGLNSFDKYKVDFKTDTGREWKDNIPDYIIYYNTRVIEASSQVNAILTQEITLLRDSISNLRRM